MKTAAIEGVGREALVIKGASYDLRSLEKRGPEILGPAIVFGMRSGIVSEASVHFTEAMYDEYIAPRIPPMEEEINYPRSKLVVIRFSCGLGHFLSHNVWPGGEKLDDWLENVRLVDKFNFEWGMAPETFQDVPGYGEMRKVTK